MSDFSLGPTMSDTQGYLRPEEIMQVIDRAKSLRDKMVLWLLFATGCRLTELLMLKVKDVSFRDRVLFMWTLKRREERRFQRPVLVDESTIDLIREYMQFYGIKNGVLIKISGRRVRQIVYETGVLAGIPRVGTKKIHARALIT